MFTRLKRLFNTNVIVRKVGKDKLRVVDNDHLQSLGNQHNSKYVDRFTRLHGVRPNSMSSYQPNYNYFSSKVELYTDYECLAGSTIIPTVKFGMDKTIQELAELYPNKDTKFLVYSYDKDSQSIKIGNAHSVRKTKTAQTYKITFDDGKTLIATDNHPIMLRNGEYKLVADLVIGDRVMTFYNDDLENVFENNCIILDIQLHEVLDVYDMTVDEYHNFATDTCFVHNCMDQDPIIASALDIYCDSCVLKDDFGDVLRITSNNENIKKILHNLFYDILNIDFNLWPWVRNMVKYGDLFLKLDIQEEIGIVNVIPLSAYEIIREEGNDPNNPYHVSFKQLGGGSIVYENYEIAHFRLLNDSNFLPYGKSMIEPARKVWKQLTLLEDAMLINRVMRAPEKRIFKIDVGNIPPAEVDNYMQKIMNQMRKTPYLDPQTGDYNLKFNMQNMLEDYFLPVRGGSSGTEIDTLPGMDFTGIDDIEYLRNKMMSALKVPKAFLNYEAELSGKATLAAEDVRFSQTIERIQRMAISELHKIAIVHLYAQGFTNAELVDFELSMTSPSTVYEQEKLTLYSSKVDLAGSMLDKKLMPKDWIYKNIFNFTDDDIAEINKGVVYDQKESFRLDKIVSDGEDPANPVPKQTEKAEREPESSEKPEPEAESEEEGSNPFTKTESKNNSFEEGIDSDLVKKYDNRASDRRKQPEVPKGGWPGAGRPKEGMKYNTHEHPRGYDPLGRVAWKNARNESAGSIKKYGLEGLIKKKPNILHETTSLLDEDNIIAELQS